MRSRVYLIAEPVQVEQPQLHLFEEMCAQFRSSTPAEEMGTHSRFVGVGITDEDRIVIDLCIDV